MRCHSCGCSALMKGYSLLVPWSPLEGQFAVLLRNLRKMHTRNMLCPVRPQTLHVLPRDADKTAADPFAAAAAAAWRKAEDADEGILTAGAIVPTGGTMGSVHMDDAATKKLLTVSAAAGYIADGTPANTIAHLGERFKLLTLARDIKPDYMGGIPSWYLIDKQMMGRAATHLAGRFHECARVDQAALLADCG